MFSEEVEDNEVSTLTAPSRTVSYLASMRGSTASAVRSHGRLSIIKPCTSRIRMSLDKAKNELSMAKLRFKDDVIYGRDVEAQVLEDAFTKAYNKQIDRQLLLVEGAPGVGKSALVTKVLIPAALRRAGFFVGGKFDQQIVTDEPYSVFTEACSELVDALLAHQARENQANLPAGNNDDYRDSTTLSSKSSRSDDAESRRSSSVGYTCSSKWAFTFQEVQDRLRADVGEDLLQVLTTVFCTFLI